MLRWAESMARDNTMSYEGRVLPTTVADASEQSVLERKFTSTTAKLLKHSDRFGEWAKGVFMPISLQIAPTDKCNLACEFCSVGNRAGDELEREAVKTAISKLAIMGLMTVEFTGGGDPTLYDGLPDLINHADNLGLGIGLITNGLALADKIDQHHLDMFDWVRISMNVLDAVDDITIPVFSNQVKSTTLGFSYVINRRTEMATIQKVIDKMDEYSVAYLRAVPNCLSVETIAQSKQMVASMGLLEHPRVFWQEKHYDVPQHCRVGYLKPFLNADGYFYHCSANPLISRKFNPSFRMGRIDAIKSIWRSPYTPFSTDICQGGKCFFKEHNDFLDMFEMEIAHRDFV